MKNCSVILGFIILLSSGCSQTSKLHQDNLRVRDAFYYSWFASESLRGTNVEILVTELGKEIIYDSLVFRGGAFPLTVERTGKMVKLSATDAISGFEQLNRSAPADLPDQLIYSLGGRRYRLMLDNIRSDGMRYLKRE